jgi:hypothetical protein
MKIYTLLRKGENHPVFCEDFLITHRIEGEFFFGAVSDGCSSGVDSHFASALQGKVLKKILHDLPFRYTQAQLQNFDAEALLRLILSELLLQLKSIRNQLGLIMHELLATLILLIYNEKTQKGIIAAIGDGFVRINDHIHEIDQQNRPDYLGYHLEDNFEEWLGALENKILFESPQEIAIASDGVATFQTLKTDLPENLNPLLYLLEDDSMAQVPQMLTRKFNILNTQHGYRPYDDVSIIRVKFENNL